LPTPRRHWAILAIWITMSLAVLDGSIANVALPTIARELGASPASSIWIVNAFQLAIVVTVLPLSALGDRFGYRRVYLIGVAVFTASSLACALSQTLPQLVVARVVQGLGAAGVMSINTALVRFTYPDRLLGRGVGLNGLVVSISAALGPSVAAAILAAASWHWLFAVNVPIGLAALAIGARSLPRTRGAHAPFDVVSALLNAVALGGLVLGVEVLVRESALRGLAMLAAAVAAGVLLVRRELQRPRPLVPLDLLRIPLFALSMGTSFTSFFAQGTAFVALPFFFQNALGRTAVQTGLLITAWPVAVGLAAPVSGRLADRFAPGALGGLGLMVFAAGLFALSQIRAGAPDAWVIAAMVVCGLGFGFFQSPNARALISATPRHRSGASGGILSTGRLLGQSGGALTTAVFFHFGGPRAASWALAAAAVVALAAAVVSLSRLRLAPALPVPTPANSIPEGP
jgi:DHA2 family multidrug resistance protein-like MFS transporter